MSSNVDVNVKALLHCAEDIADVREHIVNETNTQLLEQLEVQCAVLATLLAFTRADIERKLFAHYAADAVLVNTRRD